MILVEISMDPYVNDYKKVNAIKAVRAAVGWSLKEAKGLMDGVSNGPQRLEVLNGEVSRTLISEMRQAGYRASTTVIDYSRINEYVDELRPIASQALLAGDTMFAEDLVNIIKRYELQVPLTQAEEV